MGFAKLFALGLVAVCWSLPAKAVVNVYEIRISGLVNGYEGVFYDPEAPFCDGVPGSHLCHSIRPFSGQVSTVIHVYGETPAGYFEWGNSRSTGEFTGTIIGSVQHGLSGVGLSYGWDPSPGIVYQFGTAQTFSATLLRINDTAVPEPGTWLMLVIGFGAIGAAARHRPVVAVA